MPHLRIVRHADLEPSYTVLRAREEGFRRSLVTWLGGPEGYINTNPAVAIESRQMAVGLMDMAAGQRQPGVHTHSIDEIYVILAGRCESFDGVGNRHEAGPLDCLYIPKGVPHGVRTLGDETLRLLWINDDIERWGVSVYAEGPGPHPAADEVHLVRWADMVAARSGRDQLSSRRDWSWVGAANTGPNCSPDVAWPGRRVGVRLTELAGGDRLDGETARGNRLLVVTAGSVEARICDGASSVAGTLDAVWVPAGAPLMLANAGSEQTHIVAIETAA